MQGVLSGVNAVDLSGTRGNGPFRAGAFLGVILHVNVGDTTPSFYAANQVCPNFQVHFDGSIDQLLPLNWQPWCQSDGNTNYAAIETSGYPKDALTEAQVQSCALIIRQYVQQMGMLPQLAETPGARGFGWHGMGGNAWGGHPGCPGEPRKAQRARILSLATGGQTPLGAGSPVGAPTGSIDGSQAEDDMPTIQEIHADTYGILTSEDVLGRIAQKVMKIILTHPVDARTVDGPPLTDSPFPPADTTVQRFIAYNGVKVGEIQSQQAQILALLAGGVQQGPSTDTAALLAAIQALPAETVAALKAAL